MGGTIVDYLEGQRASFADVSFGDVDSLVLATVAYFRFENGTLGRTLAAAHVPLSVAVCGISRSDLYGGIWLETMSGDEFLAALLSSPRFMELEVAFYANEISPHFEKQFAAITFFLPDGSAYIAYRGTDNTVAGWKEDFNLTFMEEVPSQAMARSYLEDVAGACSGCLYVGGHSKGGNLAEYAALTCREQTFSRLKRVYNHDGPGFAFPPNDRISSADYDAKLSKTIPKSSIFGMLMEDRDSYRIVDASGILFVQHASTRWAIEDGEFVTVGSINREAAIIANTLNGWAHSYDPAEREQFIEAVFGILTAPDVVTWAEMSADKSGSALAIADATRRLPANMRSTVLGMLRDIAPIMAAAAAETAKRVLPR